MRLFVKGFPTNWKKDDLVRFFSAYGATDARTFTDRGGNSCATVDVPDESQAQRAIREKNQTSLPGAARRLMVKLDERTHASSSGPSFNQPRYTATPTGQSHPQPRTSTARTPRFPYRFGKRDAPSRELPASHDRLLNDRVDIAFEVTWKALSPVATNPCVDPKVNPTCPSNARKEFAGYNKRWLMIDGCLAISPFTVKSAVANGVANLLGGCYRVIREAKGHRAFDPGQYQYDGGYKRYRVSMSHSKPGIIRKLTVNADGSRSVEIQPVVEYFYDKNTPPPGMKLIPGEQYFAEIRESDDKLFIEDLSYDETPKCNEEVCYYGPYRFGMDLKLGPKALDITHEHRFYAPHGPTLPGKLPSYNFEDKDTLKTLVYTGNFKPRHPRDSRSEGGPWFEDLTRLNADGRKHWVYYQEYNGQVTNIGQNFQFKAMFLHEETVPPTQELCRNRKELCPRCGLFGMIGDPDEETREAVGYKGRFKASALVDEKKLQPKCCGAKIPDERGKEKLSFQEVTLTEWVDEHGNTVCRQFLMPIFGSPKPNKPDVDGYFVASSRQLKGPKSHIHALCFSSLKEWNDHINGIDRNQERTNRMKFKYSHRLRNYAAVCASGEEFSGTIGIENASVDEIAAVAMLLDAGHASHGFKIGLGKSEGLGSMASTIQRVWVRNASTYRWEPLEGDEQTLLEKIDDWVPGVVKAVERLKNIDDLSRRLNVTKYEGVHAARPTWPRKGQNYWIDGRATGLEPYGG